MFNNKYNPDVVNSFNQIKSSYDRNSYQLKDEPYKLIINDDKNILKNDNFEINISENKKDILKDYDIISKERNIKSIKKLTKKNMNEIVSKFKLKNTELFNNSNIDIPDDFEDIRDNFKSSYKDQEKEIKKERNKFNNILDSLLEEGLLE